MNHDIDIHLARALMPETGTPNTESRARDRAQLLAYVGAPVRQRHARRAPAAWRSDRRTRIATAVAGAAAAAGVLIATVGGAGAVNPPPASAATILAKAADAVTTAMAADPSPGQYLFTKEIWVSQANDSESDDTAGSPASVEVTQDVETWQNTHGGVQTRDTTRVNGAPVDASQILLGNNHGSYRGTRYGTVEGAIGLGSGGLGNYSYAQLEDMPTDVTALRSYLAQLANNGSTLSGTQTWIDHEMFGEIHDILTEQLVPAKLRVALYQVAATIPGVTSLGETRDAAGRDALVITFSDHLYNERDELLFDPTTYLLTGESEVNVTSGETEDSQTVVASQIVDQIPAALQAAAANAEAVSR